MPWLPLWGVDPPLAGPGGGPLSNLTAVDSDTALAAAGTPTDTPEPGDLVRVRGQQWVVSALARSHQPVDELAAASQGRTLVTLTSVSDDDLGDELTVAWEIEPGREVLPSSRLPEVTAGGLDDPNRLGAFLDAVRWGTVASADTRTLQAPFRSGIVIKDYQLVPVARALAMPRVNLLIADDVGLGKTVEAGLIVQEMLLRHRARRVIVVCPASLTGKWRAEMADRFGLAFDVLDAARLKALRRSHGLEANPFAVLPRTIISLQWLRSPRIQRLLDEVLDGAGPGRAAFFDLLIVDEAHHCAPPAPSRAKGYAVDSKQTQAVRRLGEHAGHRLFLSATPHNGYPESWQALLEMLDPARFLRGAEPDPDVLAQVMVRRLKDTIVDADGNPEFAPRATRALEVTYTDDERQAHRLLADYTRARRRGRGQIGVRLDDLVTLLLKKRLFSSPAAFAATLDRHAATLARPGRAAGALPRVGGDDSLPEWLVDALSWEDEPDDTSSDDDLEGDLLERAVTAAGPERGQPSADLPPTGDADALLNQLQAWADRHAEPADAKALALVAELERICRPDGVWNDERVIVFTEYVDTLRWLADTLTARGLGGERLATIYGGMDDARRERIKAAFQAGPERDPLRILLATDAASEGIDLQLHCHRVVNYDIPFNPNRLEQRIGRVDRLGQRHPVEVLHFVGAGWQQAPAGSYEADLEFLARVAAKVANERRDLGSVNPVLAAAVEARMLGRPVLIDPTTTEPAPAVQAVRAERDLRASMERIRAQLDDSTRRLHVAPANVRRVVDVGLELAGQPPLVDLDPALSGPGVVAPPALKGGWERTVAGLADPFDGHLRPLTFDPAVAAGRDDVVLAHLEHPLVARCTRLLRSAIWGDRLPLHRVTAVRAPVGGTVEGGSVLVAAFARLVVVGADGARLHEEVVLAGRELPASGRTRRVELEAARYSELRARLEAALDPRAVDPDACDPAPTSVAVRVAEAWPSLAEALADDVARRADAQVAALDRSFARRRDEEAARTAATYDQLRVTLAAALQGPAARQLSFDDLELAERQQLQRDRRAWEDRLDRLDTEAAAEQERIAARYRDLRSLVFPFAVVAAVADTRSRP